MIMSWSMGAMLCDIIVVVAGRTASWSVLLAMLTMKKVSRFFISMDAYFYSHGALLFSRELS